MRLSTNSTDDGLRILAFVDWLARKRDGERSLLEPDRAGSSGERYRGDDRGRIDSARETRPEWNITPQVKAHRL